MRRTTSLIHTCEIKTFAQFTFSYVILIITDIDLCKDTYHVIANFRAGPRAAHLVVAGDLVRADNMLVTPCFS